MVDTLHRAEIEEMIEGTAWIYVGDESPLDYGGKLIKMDNQDLRHGFAECIEIIGADQDYEHDYHQQTCTVERGSIFLKRSLREWRNAYACCGYSIGELVRSDRRERQVEIISSARGMDVDLTYRTKRENGLRHILNNWIS